MQSQRDEETGRQRTRGICLSISSHVFLPLSLDLLIYLLDQTGLKLRENSLPLPPEPSHNRLLLFKTGSHVAQARLKLSMYMRMSWNLWSLYLHLVSTKITKPMPTPQFMRARGWNPGLQHVRHEPHLQPLPLHLSDGRFSFYLSPGS